MKLLPYARHTYPSPLPAEVLLQNVRGRLIAPGSALNALNFMHHLVFEGTVEGATFVVSGTRYGLTYGRTGSVPLLKGTVRTHEGGGCRLTVVVRPSVAFLAGMSVLYGGVLALLLRCWHRGDEHSVLFLAFSLCVTSAALLHDYNRFYNRYQRLIEDVSVEGRNTSEST